MARTTRGFATRLGRAIVVVAAVMAVAVAMAMAMAMARAQSTSQEPPIVQLWWDFEAMPRLVPLEALMDIEAVQQELKLTDAQKAEQAAIVQEQYTRIRQATREIKDRAKLPAARDAIIKENTEALLATIKPEQRDRLDQIQLQAQGPHAFTRAGQEEMAADHAGTPLSERLKLSDDQVRRIRAIVGAGEPEIQKAASFPIPMDPSKKPSTADDLRKLVEGPAFQGAKDKARQLGRETRAALLGRVEEVLTEPQRRAYRAMLGRPFDLSRLRRVGPEQERQIELNVTARALGLGGGGQRADTGYNTRVAHPAYAGGAAHPRVLLDEAHYNFHTASGRYKPFAELITSDGYRVIPNKEKFARDALSKGDILVIANALGAAGMGQDEASNPAFTDAECDAVRDWVKGGGSLLLITDHAPMGSAAQCLAARFGVEMSKGAVGDPNNSEGGPMRLVFSRQNHLLGDHPITRGRDDSERINKVMTFTGTSLEGPEGSAPILKLSETAMDHSLSEDGTETSAAGRAQGLAFPFGKGRVVVMGEAAELSAQVAGLDRKMGMNVPGIDNRQMALNILHWLSGLLEPREGALKKAG